MRLPSYEEARLLSRKTGLFFICASCPKMWEGQALGKDGCTGKDCGSPSRKKDFPEYNGSVKDLSTICFVCGEEDVLAYAQLEGSDRPMGICKSHLDVVDNHVPKTNGIVTQDRKLFIYPKLDKVLDPYRNARDVL